jgi:hypothetical protein
MATVLGSGLTEKKVRYFLVLIPRLELDSASKVHLVLLLNPSVNAIWVSQLLWGGSQVGRLITLEKDQEVR